MIDIVLTPGDGPTFGVQYIHQAAQRYPAAWLLRLLGLSLSILKSRLPSELCLSHYDEGNLSGHFVVWPPFFVIEMVSAMLEYSTNPPRSHRLAGLCHPTRSQSWGALRPPLTTIPFPLFGHPLHNSSPSTNTKTSTARLNSPSTIQSQDRKLVALPGSERKTVTATQYWNWQPRANTREWRNGSVEVEIKVCEESEEV